MYKPSVALMLWMLISSFTNKHQPTKKEYILGNWVEVNAFQITSHGNVGPSFNYVQHGFTFYKDNTFENKLGYFREDTLLNKRIYIGNFGISKIKGDSLLLFGPGNDNIDKYRLLTLNADTLKIEQDSIVTAFKHYEKRITKTPAFDKIIISSSGCFGTCPSMNIMIDAHGSVLFDGGFYASLNGWYTGTIPVSIYDQLQNNFRQVDFDSLKTYYRADWTDDQTIYTTFVKGNKIYKSVLDYGRSSPCFFIWARTPLQYLYQTIKLNKLAKPDSIPEFETLIKYNSKKNDPIVRLMYSEQFLLIDYLHHGKKVANFTFKPRFKLAAFYSHTYITTDGRYYSFIMNGKEQTIDIGFNFIDINNKNWKWIKPAESGY